MSAAAQAPVYRPGAEVTAPFVVARTKPAYSAEARLAKLEGSVLLSLVVQSDGRPRDIHVIHALGLGLDESAVENARTWQFRPGTRQGTPVDVLAGEEVFFRSERTLWDWHTTRVVFDPPAAATRPVLVKTKFPPTLDEEENVSVTLAFDVSPNGLPVNLRVARSSDAKWEAEVLGALRSGWRFRPGRLEGQAVAVPAWIEFVRGSHSPIPPVKLPER